MYEQLTLLQEVALSLLGRHYVLHSCNPSIGFDCATFVIHCLKQARYNIDIEIPLLRPSFGQHKKSTIYTDIMDTHFTRVKDLFNADLIVLKYGCSFNHGGIVLPDNTYIHCALAGGVRIDSIDTINTDNMIYYRI